MKPTFVGLIALATLAGAAAQAQTAPHHGAQNSVNVPSGPATTSSGQPAATTRGPGERTTGVPVPGANSFTEGEARRRIEAAGFSGVTGLKKDDQGVWRGQANRNGSGTSVALDYQGGVFSGAAATAAPASGQVANGSGARDGTTSNPPGTAATRTFDRAAGTNTSGAYPNQSDGTPANPAGTAVGRATDRVTGSGTAR